MGPKSVGLTILFPVLIIVLSLGVSVVTLMAEVSLLTSLIGIAWIIGFGCFFAAKMSVMNKGNLLKFGTADMAKHFRYMYILGYSLMGVGTLGAIAVLLLNK